MITVYHAVYIVKLHVFNGIFFFLKSRECKNNKIELANSEAQWKQIYKLLSSLIDSKCILRAISGWTSLKMHWFRTTYRKSCIILFRCVCFFLFFMSCVSWSKHKLWWQHFNVGARKRCFPLRAFSFRALFIGFSFRHININVLNWSILIGKTEIEIELLMPPHTWNVCV